MCCAESPKALLLCLMLFCSSSAANCFGVLKAIVCLLGLLVHKALFMLRFIILHVFYEEVSVCNITFCKH